MKLANLLQALLPTIIGLLPFAILKIFILLNKPSLLILNISSMIASWTHTVHPVICFVYIRSLRNAFHNAISSLIYPLNSSSNVKSCRTTVQAISQNIPNRTSLFLGWYSLRLIFHSWITNMRNEPIFFETFLSSGFAITTNLLWHKHTRMYKDIHTTTTSMYKQAQKQTYICITCMRRYM